MVYPPIKEAQSTVDYSALSDHLIVQAQLGFLQRSKKNELIIFNKQKAFLLCKRASKKAETFQQFYSFVKKRIISCGVISKHRIRIKQLLLHEKPVTELLKSIDKNFQENQTSLGFQKIKKVTILNPDKRDGSIFNAFLDINNEIQFNQESENCLNKLAEISGWREWEYHKLPSLPALSNDEVINYRDQYHAIKPQCMMESQIYGQGRIRILTYQGICGIIKFRNPIFCSKFVVIFSADKNMDKFFWKLQRLQQ